MCRPASMIVTKTSVLWSKYSDSHEDIIDELSLHMDGIRGPNGVRVEICPQNGNLSSGSRLWEFRVDQDLTPEWWDAADAEKRVRVALKAWKKQKVITKSATLKGGQYYVYGSATVTAYDSATVNAYNSVAVTAYDSVAVNAFDSVAVNAHGSGTVTAHDSVTIISYRFVDPDKMELKSKTAVIIDRSTTGKVNVLTGK